jgi:hypothetical protein
MSMPVGRPAPRLPEGHGANVEGRAVLDPQFVIIAALLSTTGNVKYVVDTIRGRIRPSVMTWSLWSIPPTVAFVAEITGGAGLEAMLTFAVATGPLAVVIACVCTRHAHWTTSRLDLWCCGLCLSTIVLWMLTSNCALALTFAILTDALAAVPTAVKTYREPDSECRKAFGLFGASAFVTLLTIKEWNLMSWGYPTYLFALSVSILAVSLVPHRRAATVVSIAPAPASARAA